MWVTHSMAWVLHRDSEEGGRTRSIVRNFQIKAFTCWEADLVCSLCVSFLYHLSLHYILSGVWIQIQGPKTIHHICVTYAFFTFPFHRCRFLNGWKRQCSPQRSTCCPLIISLESATRGRCPLTPVSRKSPWHSVARHLTLRSRTPRVWWM